MLKYVDFWYALKTTKHGQTILEEVSMETTKARAVLHNKIIIMLQDSSVNGASAICHYLSPDPFLTSQKQLL